MSSKSKGFNHPQPQPPPPARQAIISQVSYTGLIPHPDILEGFKRIDPALVNLVIKLSEQSIAKLHDLQTEENERMNAKLKAEISYDFRGQVLIFLLVVLVLAVALIAAFSGFVALSIAIVSGGFAVIVSSAIKGFTKKKEKQNGSL